MRLKAEVKPFVLARWGPWLRAALELANASPGNLAKELKDARARRDEDVDDGSIPRDLVKRWLEGEKPANAESAFAVGAALAMIGHPHSSGLLAVVAAGHFREFAQAIRGLGTTADGALVAAEIVRDVPLMAEAEVSDAQGWSYFYEFRRNHNGETTIGPSGGSGMGYLEAIRDAQQRLGWTQRQFNSAHVERGWQKRDEALQYETAELKREGALLSLAIQNAEGPKEVPMTLRWDLVVSLIYRWAGAVHPRFHEAPIVSGILRDIIQVSILLSKRGEARNGETQKANTT